MKFETSRALSVLALTSVVTCALTAVTTGSASAKGYSLVNKMTVGGTGTWDYLYMDSAARRLYVTRQTHLMVINVDTHKVIGDITGLNGIHGVALDKAKGYGYVTNGKANSVVMFSLATLAKKKEIPVGEGPDAIVFDPATQRVFAFNGHGKSFTAIDGATGNVIKTVSLAGRPEFPTADGKGHIYDNLEDLSSVISIDTKTLAVEKTWPIAPGDSPSGSTYNAKANRIYSVCANNLLTVLDPSTGKVVTTLPIGNGPDACVFDAAAKLLYSPNGKDGTMTVYHEETPDKYTLVTTFNTQVSAKTMALDPQTHHVWVGAAILLPPDPTTDGSKPKKKYKPGSFVLLEYGK